MDAANISSNARQCTEAENEAVSLWCAFHLPLCRIWAAKRGLQPPTDVIERLQRTRFGSPLLYENISARFIALSSNKQPDGYHKEYNKSLGLSSDLLSDLRQFQMSASPADSDDNKDYSISASRDIKKAIAALSHLRLSQIEIAVSELIIVPLFSHQTTVLYIPSWLVNIIPRTLFSPNQAFHRPRPVSLVWLLLDAVVIASTDDFKMVQEYYS